MATVGQYYRRQPLPQAQFSHTPLQPLMMGLQARQQRFDTGMDLADQLMAQSLNYMEKDAPTANNIIENIRNRTSEISKKYDGDMAAAMRDLRQLKRDVVRDFSPGGKSYSIQSNYDQYQSWLERAQELVDKKIIDPSQINLAAQYVTDNYDGIGEKDSKTGIYNRINLPNIAAQFNLSEEVDAYAKDFVPQKFKSGQWQQSEDGTMWFKDTQTGETLNPMDIQEGVRSWLASNKDYQAYKHQMEQFGAPISQEMEQHAINQAIAKYARVPNEFDQEMKFTPRHLFQQQAVDTANTPIDKSVSFSYGPSEAAFGSDAFDEIRPTDWDKSDYWAQMAGGDVGQGGKFEGMSLQDLADENKSPLKPASRKIMETILKNNPKSGNLDDEMYRNKIIDLYDKSINQISVSQPARIRINEPELQEELFESIIESNMWATNASFDYVDGNGNVHKNLTYPEMVKATGIETKATSKKTAAEVYQASIKGLRPTSINRASEGGEIFALNVTTPDGGEIKVKNLFPRAEEILSGISELAQTRKTLEQSSLQVILGVPLVSKAAVESLPDGTATMKINLYHPKVDEEATKKRGETVFMTDEQTGEYIIDSLATQDEAGLIPLTLSYLEAQIEPAVLKTVFPSTNKYLKDQGWIPHRN